MIAVADTSGLVALFNRSDPAHRNARAAADACGLLVVSPLAITELHQLATIRADRRTADAIVHTIGERADASRMAFATVTGTSVLAAVAVRRRYATLDLDLVDAATVVAAAEYRTDAVLTLDRRDFRAMRPLTAHPAFRLLPDDL